HEHVESGGLGHDCTLADCANARDNHGLSVDLPEQALNLLGRRRPGVRTVAAPPGGRLGDLGQLVLGDAVVAEALEAAETRELLYPRRRIRARADRGREPADRLWRERRVEAESRRKRERV